MITCCTRYEIDPYETAAFATRARNAGEAFPRCGADLMGYFTPHEGSATTARGLCNIGSPAAYEADRARLHADPLGRETYEFARRGRLIRGEARNWLCLASTQPVARFTP